MITALTNTAETDIMYWADRPVKKDMWQILQELIARVNCEQFTMSLAFLKAFAA